MAYVLENPSLTRKPAAPCLTDCSTRFTLERPTTMFGRDRSRYPFAALCGRSAAVAGPSAVRRLRCHSRDGPTCQGTRGRLEYSGDRAARPACCRGRRSARHNTSQANWWWDCAGFRRAFRWYCRRRPALVHYDLVGFEREDLSLSHLLQNVSGCRLRTTRHGALGRRDIRQ